MTPDPPPVHGFICNRCGQWHETERIPSKCENCNGVEFELVYKEQDNA